MSITKKMILLVADSIINDIKDDSFEGKEFNNIFGAYTKIKNNRILHSLGQDGIISGNPHATYIEVSQTFFEFIGNQIVIHNGVAKFESCVITENGVTILCCPYTKFIGYVETFMNKLKDRQKVTISILNEVDEEIMLLNNINNGLCVPIKQMLEGQHQNPVTTS